MKTRNLLALIMLFSVNVYSQTSFIYDVELIPVSVPNLPGLHSYAFAQDNGKWLFIGGRKDGIHARQPFNAFPASQNNTDIYVVDVATEQFWSASISTLPIPLQEQLQSTNLNFYQDADSLYIIGGYGFSVTANNHITHPYLTSIIVPDLIDAIINGVSITSLFKQITDDNFAITGGHLGKVDDMFYLVGGHRFDGTYNPMGMGTYTQTYSNQIRKFKIDNSGSQLSINNYSAITDAVHLRRRDYNLVPQIFPDGSEGYMISSGVFQVTADLPFLYPVEINNSGYTPIISFNQYLSNYHSASAALYDSLANDMHMLFFGGMSQYYYQSGSLIQDNQVPFVKTISRVTRTSDGTLHEYKLPIEMPALRGASAEFIPNENLPLNKSGIIKLSNITEDTILIGHIYGGIYSPSQNPFSNNATNTTSADTTIYAVRLIRNISLQTDEIDGSNPFDFSIYPNPTKAKFVVSYSLDKTCKTNYLISSLSGELLQQGTFDLQKAGNVEQTIKLNDDIGAQLLTVTLIFDDKFYVTKKVLFNP